MQKFTALFCCLFFVGVVQASDNTEDDIVAAESVVSEYKELRKYCAVSKGQERVDCFRDLNAYNSAYHNAKMVLSAEIADQRHRESIVSYAE